MRTDTAASGLMEAQTSFSHRRLAEINWIVPVLVVAMGLAAAKVATTLSAYYVVAGIAALTLGLVLVRHLQIGVFIYFFIAALAFGESPGIESPHSGYRAGLMPSQLFLGFLTALWIGRALFADRLKLVKSELNLPLAALLTTACLSLVVSNTLSSTREALFHQMVLTQVAEVGLLCFSICAFFLTANTLSDPRWIGGVSIPVVVLGVYFAAHRIFGFELPIPMFWGSFLLAAAIALVYSRLLFDNLPRASKIGLSLLLIVLLYAAYSRWSWVSGWIAATGAILTVSFYRSKLLALALVVLVLTALFVYPGLYHSIHEESEFGGDFERFIIWKDAFAMLLAVNPILGVGPGNYHPFVYLHNTIWFGQRTYTTAHSNYVQIATELGLVGLVVFLWVIASGIRAGNRAAKEAGPGLRWLGVAAVSIFAAVAAASIFGDYMLPSRGNNGLMNFGTTVYTWLIMGAAVAASNQAKGASTTKQ